MKCLYYLAPTLDSTHGISDDLHEVGVKDFFVHVISRDEAGLKQQHIHSSNYLETLDVVRDGLIGGLAGLVVGLLGVWAIDYFDPFGIEVPTLVYVALVGVATLFGTWEGGLIGIGNENRKLAKFHDDIAAGKFLILIYALKSPGSGGPEDDARAASRSGTGGGRQSLHQPVQFDQAGCCGRPGRPTPAEGIGHGDSHRNRAAGDRNRRVPFPQPLVVHADRLQLGRNGRHRQPHVLGVRSGLRRSQPVHGLRDRALPAPQGAGAPGGIRAGIQEARVVADRAHLGRRHRDAGARPGRLGQVRHRARRRESRRGARPAVVVELPAAGPRRRARRDRCSR